MVKAILNRGADVNRPDIVSVPRLSSYMSLKAPFIGCQMDDRPLHKASSNGHHLIVKTLIDRGAVVDVLNVDGRTPLHLAAK